MFSRNLLVNIYHFSTKSCNMTQLFQLESELIRRLNSVLFVYLLFISKYILLSSFIPHSVFPDLRTAEEVHCVIERLRTRENQSLDLMVGLMGRQCTNVNLSERTAAVLVRAVWTLEPEANADGTTKTHHITSFTHPHPT